MQRLEATAAARAMAAAGAPDIVIGGAPRSGTTSLFEWLAAHPAICGSTPKETRVLLDEGYPLSRPGPTFHERGLDAYAHYFKGCGGDGSLLLEATPDYLYQQTAVEVLPRLEPPPMLLFVLRRPAARVHSLFGYARGRAARLPRDMRFAQFVELLLRDDPTLHDRGIVHLALEHSAYARWLSRWLDVYPSDRIVVLLFEELFADPRPAMRDLAGRLGIDPAVYEAFAFEAVNETYRVRSQSIQRLRNLVGSRVPRGRVNDALRVVYRAINVDRPDRSDVRRDDDADAAAMERLDRYFAADIELLGRLTGRTLDAWR